MRKFFSVFLLTLLLLCGCAAFASVKSDYDLCMSNATCVAQVQRSRDVSTQVAKGATSDGVIPTAVGYLVSLIVGVFGGHKLAKKAV